MCSPNNDSSNSWDMWIFKKSPGANTAASWSQSFSSLGTCRTLEQLRVDCKDFLSPNLTLKESMSYFLFRKGIEPKWEDEGNAKGGRWEYIDELNQGRNHVDQQWMNMLNSMLNEVDDPKHAPPSPFQQHFDEINGIQVDIRHSRYRLAFWLKDSSNYKAREEIGKSIRITLGPLFSAQASFKFAEHKSRFVTPFCATFNWN